jgi:hypothetical protein
MARKITKRFAPAAAPTMVVITARSAAVGPNASQAPTSAPAIEPAPPMIRLLAVQSR